MRIAFSIIACAVLACCAIQSPQAGPVGFRLQSGFNPSQIPGIRLWLDSDLITGLSDGDSVTNWQDLTVYANHATQLTASKRPVYKTSVLGLTAVQFDGVDDWLEVPALGAMGTNSRSIMVKFYFTASQSGWLFGYYDPLTDYRIFGCFVRNSSNTGDGKRVYFSSGQVANFNEGSSSSDLDGAWVSVAMVRTDTITKWYVNGVLDSSDSGPSFNDSNNNKYFLGMAPNGNTGGYIFPLTGNIKRVLVYDAALTDQQIAALYAAGY